MPHISVKMLKGRSEEQKERLAAALVKTLTKELNCSEHYVTCTVEDFDAREWQDVFARDIEGKKNKLYKKAEYDPKDLL
ncbi:MAG TPA: tautomerase family protein [Candidatus Borkfalkia excrementavium]|uniref:Tautomerase family protein n=1 Tax=Candidatus Borkfalkia excrementavium TaxID=2838505 RepID=A0A9D1Z6Q5_9FIRM|nr:tautomerase family protein [Candidatus Borkfalkia excrementavium]